MMLKTMHPHLLIPRVEDFLKNLYFLYVVRIVINNLNILMKIFNLYFNELKWDKFEYQLKYKKIFLYLNFDLILFHNC